MKKRVISLFGVMVVGILTAISAFATEGAGTNDAASVMTALESGLTTAQTHMFDSLNSVLPLALAVAGVIIAVRIGYRIFKSMSRG